MKILFVTNGSGVSLAHRLHMGQHNTVYLLSRLKSNLLRGILPEVQSLSEGLQHKPDMIVFDHPGEGKTVESLRTRLPVIGSCILTDMMDADIEFGLDTMRSLDIRTLKRMVEPKNDLLPDLTKIDVSGNYESVLVEGGVTEVRDGKLIVEEFTQGIPIVTELWFSNGKPLYPAFGILEGNKFLAGDWGPKVSTQVSLLWAYDVKEPRIFQSTLKKILPIIERSKYTGPLSIASIIRQEDGKPYSISWHAGFRYNSVYGLFDILHVDLGLFLYYVATGEILNLTEADLFKHAMAGVLRATVPPYPLHNGNVFAKQIYTRNVGKIVGGFGDFSNVWPHDIMQSDAPNQYVLAGVDGIVCDVTSIGTHTERLSERLAERVGSLLIPNLQIRADILTHQIADLAALKAMRYETPRFNSVVLNRPDHQTKVGQT